MGRYYNGDIDGKFWFAIQNSDAADRFGACGYNNYLDYYFDEGHLPEIKKGIKDIKDNLGKETLRLIKKFFKENNGYNNEKLIKFFKKEGHPKTENDIEYILKEYADLVLGEKILKCVKDSGECSFTAEL